jgi:CelD/BcsL family acetyltransferase involved in cellulose biosynthesis
MLTAELIDDPAGLEPWSEQWDALAVTAGEPCGAPAWMLPWWRHAVPGRAELRSVLVRDGDELVGIAPYYVQLGPLGLAEYRVLCAGEAHRIGPLSRPGRQAEVAAHIAEQLGRARPQASIFLLEGVDSASPWAELVKEQWPGFLSPKLRNAMQMDAPTLTLTDTDYDSWFASQSSNFRQQMRRKTRQVEDRGGTVRMASGAQDFAAALEAMFRLHRQRWSAKGLEGSLKPGTEEHLREAVATLAPKDRARLWMIEADGVPVCVQLFVVAGGELNYWGGGFEPSWEALQPGQLAILAAIRDAFARGERRVDFGGGALRYKWRFSNGNDPVAWIRIFPQNRRYPLTRAQLVPKQARYALRTLAREHLSSGALDRLRLIRHRLRDRHR